MADSLYAFETSGCFAKTELTQAHNSSCLSILETRTGLEEQTQSTSLFELTNGEDRHLAEKYTPQQIHLQSGNNKSQKEHIGNPPCDHFYFIK